ncbi:MAG: capsular polysaccharide biosynthesis protein CapF [Lachnospiraceae bacterium]|nr:capsular polysaccharide biosynthesis protein CapF [Lachnospiraceae bacterium]
MRVVNILVTGAKGFIGRNLVSELKNIRDGKEQNSAFTCLDIRPEIMEYDTDTAPELLREYCRRADFVYNLAGVNRPEKEEEFMEGNFGFAGLLLKTLEEEGNTCPVMLSSSIQARLDNPYGKSKAAGEQLFREYGERTGSRILIYRFPNVFGKWCRPNYNSAVATFCHNIANDLPITINDPKTVLHLVYIDDVVEELIGALGEKEHREKEEDGFCSVPVSYEVSLGEIAGLLRSFDEGRRNAFIPDVGDDFTRKLYSTYLSYLPDEKVSLPLRPNRDERGSFTELIKAGGLGQVSVNISKPGITKGQHWHHTKCERFIVVSGHALIEERKLGDSEVRRFEVWGGEPRFVEMLPGYTHNIINLSDTEELITIMWANENFNKERPDTYHEDV